MSDFLLLRFLLSCGVVSCCYSVGLRIFTGSLFTLSESLVSIARLIGTALVVVVRCHRGGGGGASWIKIIHSDCERS